MVCRNLETGGGSQLVVRVQRWRVAARAALTLEQLLAPRGNGVKRIRVRWRLQRIEIAGERVQLLVAVALRPFRRRDLLKTWAICRYEPRVAGQRISALVHRGVAHHVADRSVDLETGAIEITPFFHAD